TGNIETTNDQDWFAVTLTAGHTYQFKSQGAQSGQGSLNSPVVQLFDQNGTPVPGLGSFPGDAGFTYTATSSATYYLAAGSDYPSLGTYKVSAVDTTVPAVDQDNVAEVPSLTITGNVTVSAGGSKPLGITVIPYDSDDTLSVKISNVP